MSPELTKHFRGLRMWLPLMVVGTGPFIFESYEPNQQFTLKANPDYYEEGQPYLDTVVFKFFKDQSALSSALRSRAIDMTWLKDPKVAALLVREERARREREHRRL